MKIRSIECPKCKGQLQVNVETKKTFCMYCRAEILITQSKSEQAEIITESVSETMPEFENMRAEEAKNINSKLSVLSEEINKNDENNDPNEGNPKKSERIGTPVMSQKNKDIQFNWQD